MTLIEKKTVIKALEFYRDSQRRKERKARKNLELKKAAEYCGEAIDAEGLIIIFRELLTIPAGEAKV